MGRKIILNLRVIKIRYKKYPLNEIRRPDLDSYRKIANNIIAKYILLNIVNFLKNNIPPIKPAKTIKKVSSFNPLILKLPSKKIKSKILIKDNRNPDNAIPLISI